MKTNERTELRRKINALLDRRWMAILAGDRVLRTEMDLAIAEARRALRTLR